jgi:hypothetical protein
MIWKRHWLRMYRNLPDPVAGQLLLYVAVPQFYHLRLLPPLLSPPSAAMR